MHRRVGVEFGDLAEHVGGAASCGYSNLRDLMPAFSQPATLLRT
jgi:hypothetical protein